MSRAIEAYFNVADELDGGLTLPDLDPKWVKQAQDEAVVHDLPWPPELRYAEEWVNTNELGGI